MISVYRSSLEKSASFEPRAGRVSPRQYNVQVVHCHNIFDAPLLLGLHNPVCCGTSDCYPTCCPLVCFSHIREHRKCCLSRCYPTRARLEAYASLSFRSRFALVSLSFLSRFARTVDGYHPSKMLRATGHARMVRVDG